MRVLFLGDIVGKPGRRILKECLSDLKKEYQADVCIANAENAAGFGITPSIAKDIFSYGVDVLTLGNHTFSRNDIFRIISSEPRLVRPSNIPGWPGNDSFVFDAGEKGRLLVLNLLGSLQINPPGDSPFHAADRLLETEKERAGTRMAVLDFHAEVSSEKVAMGYHLDGKVSLCLGTHIHVPTADTRILERGTGVVTDTGMTGAENGILGMQAEASLRRLRDRLPVAYEAAAGSSVINGIFARLDPDSGKCLEIHRVDRRFST